MIMKLKKIRKYSQIKFASQQIYSEKYFGFIWETSYSEIRSSIQGVNEKDCQIIIYVRKNNDKRNIKNIQILNIR